MIQSVSVIIQMYILEELLSCLTEAYIEMASAVFTSNTAIVLLFTSLFYWRVICAWHKH